MNIDKIRDMMNFAIEAIGKDQLNLDSFISDRNDLGREFRIRDGLEGGAQHFQDEEFVWPQREFIDAAYKAVGAKPRSWNKAEVCADLLALLDRAG